MAAMRPPAMPMSASKRGARVPSMTVALRISEVVAVHMPMLPFAPWDRMRD